MDSVPSSLQDLSSWTLGEVARLTGGRVDSRWEAIPFGPISTDTRTTEPGDIFLALVGERLDGHKYCATAVERGAAGLIVNEDYQPPSSLEQTPILRVPDTLAAYGDLAAERRRQWGGAVLAISGSGGKTTTRRLVASALGRHRRVLEPVRNYNNLIGVPYTLLGLRPEHEVAVMELGMNMVGELQRLTQIAQPSAALLTQISMAHIGQFRSMEELIEAKLDLFGGCAPGVPLVFNAGCPNSVRAKERFAQSHPITTFLAREQAQGGLIPDVRIRLREPLRPVGYRFDLIAAGRTIEDIEIHLFGRHHLENVAAAAALLLASGYDPAWVAEAAASFETEPLRGQTVQSGGVTLILDCYNASPDGMLGAIQSLADLEPSGRRVLVLADMLELGDQSELLHGRLLPVLRALGPGVLFALGPQSSRLAGILGAEGWQARGFDQADALADALKRETQPGDMVFFKGSHGYRLDRIAHELAPGSGLLAEAVKH